MCGILFLYSQKTKELIKKFTDYLLLEKKYSKHTIKAYETDLFAFRDFCVKQFEQDDLVKIHYNQIRSWIVELVNKEVTNRTINRKISTLKTFYKFLQKIEEVEKNPLSKHKALKVQKKVQIPFSKKEINSVIQELSIESEEKFVSARNKLIVELFYSTGIRRAELINIKEEDINIYNRTIKILGKRNKERLVTILPSVLKTLEQYIQLKRSYPLQVEELLITEKGAKIYETLVYRIINSYFSRVSSKSKKSPHMLRHTFATHLLNEGADLNSVKELLGHSSLASTQVYTHSSLEKIKQIYNQTHPRSQSKK